MTTLKSLDVVTKKKLSDLTAILIMLKNTKHFADSTIKAIRHSNLFITRKLFYYLSGKDFKQNMIMNASRFDKSHSTK